jgi:hypothetical protein
MNRQSGLSWLQMSFQLVLLYAILLAFGNSRSYTPMISDDLKDFGRTYMKHRLHRGGLPPFFLAEESPESFGLKTSGLISALCRGRSSRRHGLS